MHVTHFFSQVMEGVPDFIKVFGHPILELLLGCCTGFSPKVISASGEDGVLIEVSNTSIVSRIVSAVCQGSIRRLDDNMGIAFQAFTAEGEPAFIFRLQ